MDTDGTIPDPTATDTEILYDATHLEARVARRGRWLTGRGLRATRVRLNQGRALRVFYDGDPRRRGARLRRFAVSFATSERGFSAREARLLLHAGRVETRLVRGQDLPLTVLAALGYLPRSLRRRLAPLATRIGHANVLRLVRVHRAVCRSAADTQAQCRSTARFVIDFCLSERPELIAGLWRTFGLFEFFTLLDGRIRRLACLRRILKRADLSDDLRAMGQQTLETQSPQIQDDAQFVLKIAAPARTMLENLYGTSMTSRIARAAQQAEKRQASQGKRPTSPT